MKSLKNLAEVFIPKNEKKRVTLRMKTQRMIKCVLFFDQILLKITALPNLNYSFILPKYRQYL